MPGTAKKIVIVEDDESIRKTFFLLLNKKYKVYLAKDAEDALQRFRGLKVDLVITDLKLPDRTGLELVCELRGLGYRGEAMLISAFPDLLDIEALSRCGISHYYTKPLDLDLFSRSIDQLLESRESLEKRI